MIEYPILPAVRQLVSRLAAAARYALLACAVLAVVEPLLLVLYLPLGGIACGLVSSFLLQVAVVLVVLVAVWCHVVLLAGRGNVITRWMLAACSCLAPIAPVSWVYTLFSGELLLYRQGELILILCIVLLLAAALNIPRMAAARWQLQLRVLLLPLLLLLVLCCDVPGLVLPCAALKVLATWVAASPLRMLQSVAPRIIAMPELD
ncbi:MAG: hypothetical protein IKY92_06295 [Akkermansia sp.]|nr:hypothetical protein [Akkermansia sp.]